MEAGASILIFAGFSAVAAERTESTSGGTVTLTLDWLPEISGAASGRAVTVATVPPSGAAAVVTVL